MVDERDGFEVVAVETGTVVRFIECTRSTQREAVLAGLLRNVDTDRYFVRDTRDAAETSR